MRKLFCILILALTSTIAYGQASIEGAFKDTDIRGSAGTTLDDTGKAWLSGRALSTTVVSVGALATCNTGTEGLIQSVNDSNTNTWANTVAAGGADHILTYCDGMNWTVAAK